MELKKFQEKNIKQKAIIIGSIVLLFGITGLILYRSFAIFEEYQDFKVIEGDVPEQNYDVMLSYTIEDQSGNRKSVSSVPDGRNYDVTIVCNEGAKGYWDYNEWGPNIRNLSENRTKCYINFAIVERYKESILNGADPVLSNGLVPVVIENDGVVKKANLNDEWYNYETQKWANAVILEDESVSYDNNQVIPESNIESYFVWIPRYKYKIFNTGIGYTSLSSVIKAEQTIDIEFETKESIVSDGSTVGNYLTHPAFQAFETNGIWVGKFETGYKGATNTEEAQQNIYDVEKVEIKPNVYSWRNIQVANAHLNSYNYKREYDSHMMKNTEWGAVAYLQHSKYGSRQSVRINNNSNYITGYSSINEPTCGWNGLNEDCNRYERTVLNTDGEYTKRYNSETGYSASTTGNITGIYDMSGGAWEYVMGMMLHSNGEPCVGRDSTYTSGFAGPYCNTSGSAKGHSFPDKKYYNNYVYGTDRFNFNRRILGDATGEIGPFGDVIYKTQTRQISSWYADESRFLFPINHWFVRGGMYDYGQGAGIFNAGSGTGSVGVHTSFRIVLAF